MRGDKLTNIPVRGIISGFPKTGKTGSVAALLNAGYKVRVLDYDGNPESILQFTQPDKLKNLDVVVLEDKIVDAGGYLGVQQAQAFMKGFKLMNRWKYEDPDGDIVDEKSGKRYTDLGPSHTWGSDTVLLLDGTTGMGSAAFRHGMAYMNRTPTTVSQPMWGFAMSEMEKFVEAITARSNNFHVIAIAHLKMIGPREVGDKEDDLNKMIKREQGDIIETRLYPTALGRQLPQTLLGHFPISIMASLEDAGGGKAVRRFKVEPTPEFDVAMPLAAEALKGLKGLGPSDGLLRIFKALGHEPPN